ncbi:MAG TPA: zf-HC2 domain-containing protein [Gemmatimonadales bacterium]|nr:zf-HC2 domain-containing protein [Gemmatimonadales bacterium]
MHPTEGMWQEFLDQETPASERQELELHLSSCPSCCTITIELGHRRAKVSQLLNELEASVPSRNYHDLIFPRGHGTPRRLLWAAGIALCVASAASATIHWGVWQRAREWLLGPKPYSSAPAVLQQRPGGGAVAQSGISLQPRERIDVLFDEVPAGGEIEIILRDDPGVSIIASEPVRFSVRSGSVSVANGGVAADYRIALPANLPQASVRVAGRLVCAKHGTTLIGEARRTGPRTYVISFSSGPHAAAPATRP